MIIECSLDEPRCPKIPEAVVENTRRHTIAPGLKDSRPGRPDSKLPEDSERPTSSQKIHCRHEGATRGRTTNILTWTRSSTLGHSDPLPNRLHFDFRNATMLMVSEFKTSEEAMPRIRISPVQPLYEGWIPS